MTVVGAMNSPTMPIRFRKPGRLLVVLGHHWDPVGGGDAVGGVPVVTVVGVVGGTEVAVVDGMGVVVRGVGVLVVRGGGVHVGMVDCDVCVFVGVVGVVEYGGWRGVRLRCASSHTYHRGDDDFRAQHQSPRPVPCG